MLVVPCKQMFGLSTEPILGACWTMGIMAGQCLGGFLLAHSVVVGLTAVS